MTATLVRAEAAAAALLTLLRSIPGVTVYDGGEVNRPGFQPALDSDGLVHPYLVLWAGIGRSVDPRLGPGVERRDWRFDVVAVGGDAARCQRAADRCATRLVGSRLTFEDGTSTRIRQVPGTEESLPQQEADAAGYRHSLPLMFTCRLS